MNGQCKIPSLVMSASKICPDRPDPENCDFQGSYAPFSETQKYTKMSYSCCYTTNDIHIVSRFIPVELPASVTNHHFKIESESQHMFVFLLFQVLDVVLPRGSDRKNLAWLYNVGWFVQGKILQETIVYRAFRAFPQRLQFWENVQPQHQKKG